jgi:hypothetical protein
VFNTTDEFSMEPARNPVARAPFAVQYVGSANRICFVSG